MSALPRKRQPNAATHRVAMGQKAYGAGLLILSLEKVCLGAVGPIEIRNRAGRVADHSAASKRFSNFAPT